MVAAVGLKLEKQNAKLAKQNAALASGMAKINSMVAKNNTLLKEIGNDLKGLKKGMSQIDATTKDTNQRAIARDNKEEIQDAVKQFVYEAGLEVENIKKNSSSLERFAMYLAISETIKLNSNIKVEIINTIQGKKEFKAVMDSIENGMKESLETIPEKELEDFIKLNKANEDLHPHIKQYNKTKYMLDMKIQEKDEVETNFLSQEKQNNEQITKSKEGLERGLKKWQYAKELSVGGFKGGLFRICVFFVTLGLSVDQFNKQFCCRGWLFT